MPRDIRRVITGHDASGNAVVMIDETMTADMGHVLTPEGQPNVRLSDVWLSDRIPASNAGNTDTVGDKVTLEPPAGGAVFRMLEIPPDSQRNYDTVGGLSDRHFRRGLADPRRGGGLPEGR